MVRRGALVALGLIAASAAACDEDAGLVSVQPDIEVQPAAGTVLVFDEAVLGVTDAVAPRIVEIRNVGDGVLDLRAASVRGDGADQYRVSSFPEQLAPGAAGELFVRFEPTVTGTTTPELLLETSDPDERDVTWPLQGYARDPCQLRASPPNQIFALNETRSVRLTASSTYRCVVTDLSTDESLFTLTDAPPLPFVLEAGASLDLSVLHSGVNVQPGVPVRQLRVREAEGSEQVVSFEGEPPLYGCLQIFPDRIDFGTFPLGQSRERTVTIRNQCSRPGMVIDANVGTGFYAYSVLEQERMPITLPARETTTLTVRYRPETEVGDFGRLTILTNDAQNPRAQVELFGAAAPVLFDVFPREVDFGTVAYRPIPGGTRSQCASSARVVQGFNIGAAPVQVSNTEIEATSDPLFQISSVTVDGAPVDFTQPYEVPVNAEMRVSMIFSPSRRIPEGHLGTLRLDHNGPQGSDQIRLTGNGGNDGATEDVFTQLPGPKVDILWVIDNSCSMFDEQARLIGNLSQFVGFADAQNADYQMAVTDTDAESPTAGEFDRCFPHPTIVGSSYADRATRETAFRCMFDVGINGSGREAGLGAAKRALERALDPNLSPNANAGFIRDDANLVVVSVSDEDDQSFDPLPVMRDFFYSIKGSRNPERFTAHAIAYPVAEPCIPESTFGSPGFGYSWMARETGGRFFNLCNEDWSPILDDIAQVTFTPLDSWELSRQADPATIVVAVDGLRVPNDPLNGWTYDFVSNAVTFAATAVPGRGAEIRVSYQGLCRP